MKLFVAGLPYDMDDAELEEFFEKFGTVVSVKVAMDRETGKSKGFAFVEMANAQEAKEAIEGLNDLPIGKKVLVVKEAEDKQGGGGGAQGQGLVCEARVWRVLEEGGRFRRRRRAHRVGPGRHR